MWKGLKDFLKSSQAPVWHTYLVSAVTISFTVIFTLVGNSWKNNDEVKITEVKSLTDSMIQFQIHASSFASSIMNKDTDVGKARTVLLENLNEQFARAKQTENLEHRDISDWRNYEDAIIKMRDVIDRTDQTDNMGPFWTAASKLLVARNRLQEKLKRDI